LKIIIDGYNLIKRITAMQHISLVRRNQFLKLLGNYAKKKKHSIVVIFDGGGSSFSYSENEYGLEIVYSGFQETADDLIVRYVRERRGQEMFLVTSDRELAGFAVGYGVDILKSDKFYELVKDLEIEQKVDMFDSTLYKMTNIESSELDELMKQGTQQIKIKEESEEKSRKSSAKKPSRAERRSYQKLKKL